MQSIKDANESILNVPQLYELNIPDIVIKHRDYFKMETVSGKIRTPDTEKAMLLLDFNKTRCRMQTIYAGSVAYSRIYVDRCVARWNIIN